MCDIGEAIQETMESYEVDLGSGNVKPGQLSFNPIELLASS